MIPLAFRTGVYDSDIPRTVETVVHPLPTTHTQSLAGRLGNLKRVLLRAHARCRWSLCLSSLLYRVLPVIYDTRIRPFLDVNLSIIFVFPTPKFTVGTRNFSHPPPRTSSYNSLCLFASVCLSEPLCICISNPSLPLFHSPFLSFARSLKIICSIFESLNKRAY